MKIYVSLSKKNRKLLKYAILFVLGCILIYYSSMLDVKAADTTFNVNSLDITFPQYVNWYDNTNGSLSSKSTYNYLAAFTSSNDYLYLSQPDTSLLSTSGAGGFTLFYSLPVIEGHSYLLYNYFINSEKTAYFSHVSVNSNYRYFQSCTNTSLSSCTNMTSSSAGYLGFTEYGNTYITSTFNTFTANKTNHYINMSFGTTSTITIPSGNPSIGFIGYKLIDITTYSDSTVQGMIEDNQTSLDNLESDVAVLQDTQQATNDKLDDQLQQDKENHEELMEENKQNTQDIIDNQNKNNEELKEELKDNFNSCRDSYNLLPFWNGTIVDRGITLTGLNGVYTFSGIWNGSSGGPTLDIQDFTLSPGTYTISLNRSGTTIYPYVSFKNGETQIFRIDNGNSTSITLTETTTITHIQFYFNSSIYNSSYSIMLNEGNIVKSFEAYGEVCSNKIDETNDKLNDLNDSLNNSDTSGANQDANNFFNNFESNDFGLSDIITLPLSTIQSITSKSCTPLRLTLPFVNKTFDLPCMTTIYSKFEPFYSIYQTITFGLISYWVCVQIYAMVKGFKDPTKDEIEVMDL